jgi:hypothetical protein
MGCDICHELSVIMQTVGYLQTHTLECRLFHLECPMVWPHIFVRDWLQESLVELAVSFCTTRSQANIMVTWQKSVPGMSGSMTAWLTSWWESWLPSILAAFWAACHCFCRVLFSSWALKNLTGISSVYPEPRKLECTVDNTPGIWSFWTCHCKAFWACEAACQD